MVNKIKIKSTVWIRFVIYQIKTSNISVTHDIKKPAIPPKEPLIELNKTHTDESQQKAEIPSSWRDWGALKAITNASKHVASITTQVSQSISTAIDSMNIPDPEEMAKIHVEKNKLEGLQEQSAEGDKTSEKTDDTMFKFDSLLSGVAQISSKVVTGGLDTLEGIGKKTINILQETDRGNKPNLSDILKEAKDRVDEPMHLDDESFSSVSFEHLLDEYHGLVFLEALEILSNQSKMKIELLIKPLTGKVLIEIEETLTEVKELCELDTENLDDYYYYINLDESLTAENFESKLNSATEDLNVKMSFSEIVNYSTEAQEWIKGETDLDPNIIYKKSIHVIAKLCALSINNLQKMAELLLNQDHRQTAAEAESLTQ